MTEVAERDEQAVVRFIERFSSVFTDSGMARMPARVFVTLLVSETGRMTAAELGELLQVSPAAISGAVRYLSQVELIRREREVGSRRDVFQVSDDVWYEAVFHKDQMLDRWSVPLKEGVETLGPDTPAGRRLNETLAFFKFIHSEMPAMLKRWHAYRAETFGS
ncbi:GbsR/MarR family transcriptional regulator [Umezawaea tangerina]|uniref:DNA-binding transcriptional regulator GbsR (MarR family) n=1 Tax=Umezawaea tangerina TaxID=84725 RepID=A0A2T0SXR3_9PSEU|nr:MarR family transcriptional regulator [Umezawaea tangerina]PRY38180.1 DNA-binding transcriptional regulator GbsR (MarR family) [Umezawaea tangerina]